MKKKTAKLMSVILLLTIFFSSFQVNASAAANELTVKDIFSAIIDSVTAISDNINDDTTPLIVKLREIFGYYNIRTVDKLKKAAQTDDEYGHRFYLKKDLVLDKEITVTGNLYLYSEDRCLKTTADVDTIFNIKEGATLTVHGMFFNPQKTAVVNHGTFSAAFCTLSRLSNNSTFYVGEKDSEATFRYVTAESADAVDVILNGPNARLYDDHYNTIGELQIKPSYNNRVQLNGSKINKVLPEVDVPEFDFSALEKNLPLGEEYNLPDIIKTNGTPLTAVASIRTYSDKKILQSAIVDGNDSATITQKLNDALIFDKLPKGVYSLNITFDTGIFFSEKSFYFTVSDFYVIHPFLSYRNYFISDYSVKYRMLSSSSVVAAADGVVEEISHDDNLGDYIKIKHNDIYTTLVYAQDLEADVKVGDTVKQGDKIGFVNIELISSDLHSRTYAYFEILCNNEPADPDLHGI